VVSRSGVQELALPNSDLVLSISIPSQHSSALSLSLGVEELQHMLSFSQKWIVMVN